MQNSLLRISGLIDDSIVDGPGLRLAVFVQGCPHACPGCHNPETHALEAGRMIGIEEILDKYKDNPLLDGVTFSGGEPFLQALPLARLAKMIHGFGGTIITYTGYVFEDLARGINIPSFAALLLEETDLLVDGPYIESLRSLDLEYRGSANQRLLDQEARSRLLRKLDSAALPDPCQSHFPLSTPRSKAG